MKIPKSNQDERPPGKESPWGPLLQLLGVAAIMIIIVGLNKSSANKSPRPAPSQTESAPAPVVPVPRPLSTAIPAAESAAPVSDAALFQHGRELSRTVCASCHLYPEPVLETKFAWAAEVLPSMALWLGFDHFDYDHEPGGERVRAARLFPDQPAVSQADWEAICNYYTMAAPDRQPPRAPARALNYEIERHFMPALLNYRRSPKNLVVKIVEGENALYIGNDEENTLDVHGVDGKTRATIKLPGPPAQFTVVSNGLQVTVLGSFRPTDEVNGSLALVKRPFSDASKTQTLIDKLHRPTETAGADFNGDGRLDYAVSEFGNFLGAFRWFEALEEGGYRPHVLMDRPGTVSVRAHDFNGDGAIDIVALMGRAWEGIHLFMNDGNGVFEDVQVAAYPPSWGCSDLELADFNRDGKMDLLAVNGDNGDRYRYPYSIKPYHGLRIYLNQGANQFEESFFFPLNGAYGAVARDFDLDGDIDIAAIGYFLDYDEAPDEGFVYLENRGGLDFVPHAFSSSISGRWISIDAGDLDGDGDLDIALGGYYRGPGIVPPDLKAGWDKTRVSLAVLINRAR